MFRVAIPNKGSLSEDAVQMLKEAGYKTRRDSRQLVLEDVENGIEFFYLRPRDIALYVGEGTLDAGITGLDLLLDSRSSAIAVQELGFAQSKFHFACPAEHAQQVGNIPDFLHKKRIASAYPHLVIDWCKEQGITPEKVVRLDGAVESSIQLGVADVIADVVSTGSTLRSAGLEIIGESILRSEALLIRSPHTSENSADLSTLLSRLVGVLTARNYVLMDYNVPNSKLHDAIAITPGFESPTIAALGESPDQASAVRVMIPRREVNNIMDALYGIGARAILVTQIHASRL
jgi:ATP phosphoribosyltransferase